MKIYYASTFLIAFAMLTLATFASRNTILSEQSRKNSVAACLLIGLGSIMECVGFALDGADPAWRIPHMIVKFVELSVTPFIPVLIAHAFMQNKAGKVTFAVLGIHSLLQLSSMHFGFLFYVDAANVYHHGSAYFIYYIVLFLTTLYWLYAVLKYGSKWQNNNSYTLIMIMILVLVATVVQAIDNEIRVVWLGLGAGLALFYIYYCNVALNNDPLTLLLNRHAFEAKVQSKAKHYGILFFDINNFKTVNDTHGHAYGDSCLKTIGEVLRAVYGEYGDCYRIGGDEFCVLLRDNRANATELNDKFVELLDNKRLEDGNLPTVAIGYASRCPEMNDMTQLLQYADEMMYSDKNRNTEVD